MSTLIISEKSKAAQAIADALGSKKTIKEGKLSVYQIPSKNLYVVPLRGHIMQYENTNPYKKWDLATNRRIITDPKSIAKIPNSSSFPYINVLKKYSKLSKKCINACDADVEGCNIGLIDAISVVKKVKPAIKIEQMWLNTLQKNDIISSFNSTIPPKWDWAYAGEGRAKIDAIIGFSATREITLTLKPILNHLGTKFASIGRVQSSLLYLLYLRELVIRNFVPEKYWALSAKISQNQGSDFLINHVKSPFKDETIARQIYQKVKDQKEGIISKVIDTPRNVPPPSPLNTSKALMLLTKNLRISSSIALKTMEDLYLNKIISYPRTDSDKYPDNFDHLQYLQKLIITNEYGKFVQDLLQYQRINPKQGKNWAGDHPPITPLLGLDKTSSKFENNLQKRVYELITRNYLASFGENAEEKNSRIMVTINDENFIGKLSVLIKEGFYTIAPFLKPKYDIDLQLTQGKIDVKNISFQEKESQPPPRYSDTTLLKLMEQKKLGTKSTRPSHIETLEKRQYIKRIKRSFYVLELGFTLMDALKPIWEPFLDPSFTKSVELRIDEIKQGKRKMDDVVDEVRLEFLDLFDKFRKNKSQVITTMRVLKQTGNIMRGRNNKIIQQKSTLPKHTQKGGQTNHSVTVSKVDTNDLESDYRDITTSLCPFCSKNKMKMIVSKDRKKLLVCLNKECEKSLLLPKKGHPRLLKTKCKICGFNIVKINVKNQKGYYVCSNCWQKSFETKEKIGLCFSCESYHVEKGNCKKKK